MAIHPEIHGFGGEVAVPGDPAYETHREVWNAVVDRRPAVIARCRSERDVAAAIAFGRREGLEIAVKCGGHSILGLSVPEGGLMLDLTPMGSVRVDPAKRRATVGGGALLRGLDRTAAPHGLATTAGNVSHTGVGGLTLGGGMGWLARQFGLACDNVERYSVVTADGDMVRATAAENADLFWGLRGGGGNFGIVTEFEFRLHSTTGQALVVELDFDAAEASVPMRRWRDLLAEAPRAATLTADVGTASDASGLPPTIRGRSVATLGYIWVGDMDQARRLLATMRSIGRPLADRVMEMTYVELQSIADDRHHHGLRRYSKSHYLRELTDAAIEAFLSRGVEDGNAVDWPRVAYGGFQAYGGAIADVGEDETAFSHRETLVEFMGGGTWLDRAEDADRIASARAFVRAMEPFSSGTYVNAIADEGGADLRRAYTPATLRRLAQLKQRHDPENVFHLNHNIAPPADAADTRSIAAPATG